MYGTSELRDPAVVLLQTDDVIAAPACSTSGQLMESLDIVPGRSRLLQGTSRPGSSHIRLCSGKPQLIKGILCLRPCCRAWFITWSESETSWTRKPLPLHIAFRGDQHIEIGSRQRNHNGFCVTAEIERQSDMFDVISQWKAIRVPIMLGVSYLLISGTNCETQ